MYVVQINFERRTRVIVYNYIIILYDKCINSVQNDKYLLFVQFTKEL